MVWKCFYGIVVINERKRMREGGEGGEKERWYLFLLLEIFFFNYIVVKMLVGIVSFRIFRGESSEFFGSNYIRSWRGCYDC